MSSSSTGFLGEFCEFAEEQRQKWCVPGVAVAIVKDGELKLAEGFGHRDAAADMPVTGDTLFSIASLTKSFTTTAIARLVDEGVLDWDRPVRSYLPDFRLLDSYASERATLRDLACHRTGLPRYDLASLNPDFTREDIVRNLAYLEPNAEFRTTFQYQNMMYTTLGYLAGKRAGVSWEELVKGRVLEPLGMDETVPTLAEMFASADYSQAFRMVDGEIVEVPWLPDEANGPAGGICSSARQMAKWMLFHLGRGRVGEEQILPAGLIQEMHTPHMVLPQRSEYPERNQVNSYGLGWYVSSYRGSPMTYHSGNIVGMTALMTLLPEERLGVVVLTNLHETPLASIVTYNVLDRVLGLPVVDWSKRFWDKRAAEERGDMHKSAFFKIEGTQPSHPLGDYTGEFSHPGMGRLRLELVNGQLQGKYGLINLTFRHHHYDTFAVEIDVFGQVITRLASFSTDHQGIVREVALPLGLQAGVKDIVFTRSAMQSALRPEDLEACCGQYTLQGMVITVSLRTDGKLLLTVPGDGEYELIPVTADRFELAKMPGYAAQFEREGNVAASLALVQPNGVFHLPRQQSADTI